MIIEVAMLLVLIYYRSWEVGVILLVLVALRRAPWFANAIVSDLSLDQYGGMTAWVARVLLPAWDGARVMSRSEDPVGENEGAVLPPTTIPTVATIPIVTPNNEYNGKLSDSDRVQFEARAKTIAELYEAGIVTNLSKAICRVYGCSVQAASKPDSTYQQALSAVNRHLTRNKPQFRQPDASTAPASYPVTKE